VQLVLVLGDSRLSELRQGYELGVLGTVFDPQTCGGYETDGDKNLIKRKRVRNDHPSFPPGNPPRQ